MLCHNLIAIPLRNFEGLYHRLMKIIQKLYQVFVRTTFYNVDFKQWHRDNPFN